MEHIHWKDVVTVSLVLFSVIDILGSIPIIIDLRKKAGELHAAKATLVAGLIMVVFLYYGDILLHFLGVDIQSFSIAGSIIIFLIGMEMVLGAHFFKDTGDAKTSAIVPLAFPLIAGAGTMTTLISLRAEYERVVILIGIVVNLALVYIVLKASGWLEKRLGVAGANILRKVFGILLLAIAIKIFKSNIHYFIPAQAS
ncbi:MarC family protein [Thermonema rossianum]|uniref:MarC family protein n=1 Tax=Thermonema rossianum TaxID=55505 RepID=UPI00056DE06B|nr:MarC family protein [Thermonema rossianum]